MIMKEFVPPFTRNVINKQSGNSIQSSTTQQHSHSKLFTFPSWNLGNSLIRISLIMSGSATMRKGSRKKYTLKRKRSLNYIQIEYVHYW